jgi:hypothetical protein
VPTVEIGLQLVFVRFFREIACSGNFKTKNNAKAVNSKRTDTGLGSVTGWGKIIAEPDLPKPLGNG